MYFINELKRRNALLFWYGIINIIAALICIILWQTTDIMVAGVNAFIKPFKFFLSIAIFVWTVGWLFYYLEMPSKIRAYTLMAILVLSYESIVITWQAANGRLSHFNTTNTLYQMLYNIMGIAIVLLTLWTGYIGYYFFKRKDWRLPMAYIWGIRLGIVFFVLFALEGGVMGAMLRHTVGGADSGQGLPLVNWNRQHGDLRIAHFLGMHTLQLFPMIGYYVARNGKSMIAFAFVYVGLVVAVLVQALMGLPLF